MPNTKHVTVCEVGPRDGLQNHARAFSVAERIAFIDRLSGAGLLRIEAVSFVNDKKVPRMADPEGVLAGIERRPGLQVAALALNQRGVERALACDLQEIRFVLVASETFSQRNQGSSIAETVAALARMAQPVKASGRRLSVVVAAAFGCPFEGQVPVARVLDLVDAGIAVGAEDVVLADTIGSGTPGEVARLVGLAMARVGGRSLGCHFHNTRNMGYANALAALEGGVTLFDAAAGGMGGCPFAPGATGNIATEDLCFMLRQMEVQTGVDLPQLIGTVEWLQSLVGDALPGQIVRAGLFPEIAAAGLGLPTVSSLPTCREPRDRRRSSPDRG